MYPPCETVGRYVLPIFRSLVAKDLVGKYNFTQMEAAEKLGTTQAAISQYIHLKRGKKGSTQFEDMLPSIQAITKEVANGIATEKMNAEEITIYFCKLCVSLREKNKKTNLT